MRADIVSYVKAPMGAYLGHYGIYIYHICCQYQYNKGRECPAKVELAQALEMRTVSHLGWSERMLPQENF